MPDFSLLMGAGRAAAYGFDYATSSWADLGTISVANTKNAWTELVASTPFTTAAFDVFLSTTAFSSCLVDIGIGAVGSERIICPDLLYGSANGIVARFYFPVSISVGSRISARYQAPSTNGAALGIELYQHGFLSTSALSRITTYGADHSDSGGVAIDPGAVPNTKGAWIEIISATMRQIKVFNIGFGARGNSATRVANFLYDLAIGPAGSERLVIEGIGAATTSREHLTYTGGLYDYAIAKGSRIAVRAQSSTNDAVDRLIDFVLYGVD